MRLLAPEMDVHNIEFGRHMLKTNRASPLPRVGQIVKGHGFVIRDHQVITIHTETPT
jgi:hypothetical protein